MTIRKTIWIALLVSVFTVGMSAEESDAPLAVYPLGRYETLSLPDTTIHAPGTGVLVMKDETFFVGQYALHLIDDADLEASRFHTIDAIFDTSRDRHRLLSLFSSASDLPVAGGWHTLQAATVYGYRVVDTDRTTLTLGGGLALADFGIEMPDGGVWPLLPVPFIEGSYTSRAVAVSFDFITGPNLNVTIAPDAKVRVVADARIDEFRSIEDLVFEAAVVYEPFSLGIANKTFSYDIAEDKESWDVGSYVLFGKLDLTVLTVTGGYAFDSWRRWDDEIERDGDSGFYLGIDVLIPLGGGGQ
jgi:hypothetical protein